MPAPDSCQIPKDQLQRFSFSNLAIRGELIYLDTCWQEVLSRHKYPPAVQRQLGQALAAVSLLGATLKFDGNLILQITGEHALRSVVAQISKEKTLRGLARWEGHVPSADMATVYGRGTIAITVTRQNGERYQSLVGLEGQDLAGALNVYFMQSEQLPTSFYLFVSNDRVAGLFLQALPAHDQTEHSILQREEDWQRVNILASTLTGDELLSLPAEQILVRLFHEESVLLYPPQSVSFGCSCSRSKVADTLRTFPTTELENILLEEGSISVNCEFCNELYDFDAAAVAALTKDDKNSTEGQITH
jgi:molecular chaperone Hsp33